MSATEEGLEPVANQEPDVFSEIKLTPWQEKVERAFNEGAKYALIKAGRKAGKSVLAKYRLVRACLRPPVVPDQTNAYIAPSKIQAKKIMWRPLKSYVCPKGNWKELLSRPPHETEAYMDFKGSGIRLSLDGAEAETTIRGWNMGDTVIDEADHIEKATFFPEVLQPNFMITRPNVLMISTPKNRWFTKMWKRAKEGKMGRQWAAFHFTSYDNPYLSREYLDQTRANTPAHIWEQEFMANEYAMSGIKYTEFDPGKHIVEPRTPNGPIFMRSLDWGWKHPTVCLWMEIFKNPETKRWNIYVFRELALRGMDIEKLCLSITSGDSREYMCTIIDKAAKRTEMGTGRPIDTEFARNGLLCIVPPRNKDYWVNSLKIMLKHGDIQISKECRLLINQLEEVEWSSKADDDATDALEYAAAYAYNRDFDDMTLPSASIQEPQIAKGGLLDQGAASWGGLDVVNW